MSQITCRKEDPLSGRRVSPISNDLPESTTALFLVKLHSVASRDLVTLERTLDPSVHRHRSQSFQPFRARVVETVVLSLRQGNQASNEEQESQK